MTDKPEKYINQAKATMRSSMSKAYKFQGSPLLVVSNRLKISHDELADVIKSEFEKNKGL